MRHRAARLASLARRRPPRVITEATVLAPAYRGDGGVWSAGAIRPLGYGLPSLVSLALVAHNVVLLAGGPAVSAG